MQENEQNTLTPDESYFDTSSQQFAAEPPVVEEEQHLEEHTSEFEIAGLNKEQLFHKLEEVLKTENLASVSNQVRLLKEAFQELVKSETDAKLNAYIEDGGLKEDFEMRKDALDDKFENLVSIILFLRTF